MGYHLGYHQMLLSQSFSRLMLYFKTFCPFYVLFEDFKWYTMVPRWYPMVPKITKSWYMRSYKLIWKRYQNQFYHSWNVCYELSVMLGFNVKTLIFEKLNALCYLPFIREMDFPTFFLAWLGEGAVSTRANARTILYFTPIDSPDHRDGFWLLYFQCSSKSRWDRYVGSYKKSRQFCPHPFPE